MSVEASFSELAFGCGKFKFMLPQNSMWVTFSTCPGLLMAHDGQQKLFHSTTLDQARSMCTSGLFNVGSFHAGSSTSPCGIWGCDVPGHAVDRAALCRGWSKSNGEPVVCGWDCPVVFAWLFPAEEISLHKHLGTGEVYVFKQPPGSRWPIFGRAVEIWVPASMYESMNLLPTKLDHLLNGMLIVCRARRWHPEDLWKAGKGCAMTCARTCETDLCIASGWKRAKATAVWTCPRCQERMKYCLPWGFGHASSKIRPPPPLATPLPATMPSRPPLPPPPPSLASIPEMPRPPSSMPGRSVPWILTAQDLAQHDLRNPLLLRRPSSCPTLSILSECQLE